MPEAGRTPHKTIELDDVSATASTDLQGLLWSAAQGRYVPTALVTTTAFNLHAAATGSAVHGATATPTIGAIVAAASGASTIADGWLTSNVPLKNTSNTLDETLTLAKNLALPTTSGSTVGVVTVNAVRFLHSYGTSNLFVGPNAGNFTMTGTGVNVGIGAYTLKDNTSGYYNFALGSNALQGNTTGYGNIAIGGGASFENTTGYYSVAIGLNAARQTTTVGNNVVIGANALRYNTSGYSNTVIGQDAGKSSTGIAIFRNTLIGSAAGTALTGSNNILIGYQAGDALTSGANNLIIGYDIDPPSATDSNQVNIGGMYRGDTNLNNAVIGNLAALATNATDGFLHLPACTGAPTSTTVTEYVGKIPVVYDSGNLFLRCYDTTANAWKYPWPQQAHIADASEAHALNAVFSDTEVEAALNALGAKINAILVVQAATAQTLAS